MARLIRTSSIRMIYVLILILFNTSGPCNANDFASPGNYLVIAGQTGFQDFQNTGVDDFSNAMGMDIRFGRRFNKTFALEGDFAMLSGFDATVDLSKINPELTGTDKIAIDSLMLTANLKAHLPLGRLDPYALIGAGLMHANVRTQYPVGYVCYPGYYYGWYCRGAYGQIDDASAFVTKLGVGTNVYLTDELAITLDAVYVFPTSDLSDLKYTAFTWGLQVKF